MIPGAPIEFVVQTPMPRWRLRSNTQWARRLYPCVNEGYLRDEVVNIIANGPSALEAPLYGITVALNGALRIFTDKGLAPTYWAACDPQRMVASFLDHAPFSTGYLVASQCDREVFRALRGRDVQIWHLDDVEDAAFGVMSAPSITLTALTLLRHMGFRRFRVWGWDGCYVNGMDHATPQKHAGQDLVVEVGDLEFQTTRTWAMEADSAWKQLTLADYEVDIQGPGMVGAIVRAKLAIPSRSAING